MTLHYLFLTTLYAGSFLTVVKSERHDLGASRIGFGPDGFSESENPVIAALNNKNWDTIFSAEAYEKAWKVINNQLPGPTSGVVEIVFVGTGFKPSPELLTVARIMEKGFSVHVLFVDPLYFVGSKHMRTDLELAKDDQWSGFDAEIVELEKTLQIACEAFENTYKQKFVFELSKGSRDGDVRLQMTLDGLMAPDSIDKPGVLDRVTNLHHVLDEYRPAGVGSTYAKIFFDPSLKNEADGRLIRAIVLGFNPQWNERMRPLGEYLNTMEKKGLGNGHMLAFIWGSNKVKLTEVNPAELGYTVGGLEKKK